MQVLVDDQLKHLNLILDLFGNKTTIGKHLKTYTSDECTVKTVCPCACSNSQFRHCPVLMRSCVCLPDGGAGARRNSRHIAIAAAANTVMTVTAMAMFLFLHSVHNTIHVSACKLDDISKVVYHKLLQATISHLLRFWAFSAANLASYK